MQGSAIKFPLNADQRGTLATTADRQSIIEQSIIDIVETRQGERVMIPDYGLPDLIFSVADADFAARLAYALEEQIVRYEPLVASVKTTIGALNGDEQFAPDFNADPQRVAVKIEYTERGSNILRNLVYPVWRLRAS